MLKMRGSAHDLAQLVREIHGKFGTTNVDLAKVLNDLQRIQQEKENTQKMIEMAATCKEITQMMLQVQKEIENDNHYSAMRIIENIQKELTQNQALQPLRKTLDMWLPIAINKLLYAARTEADIFLSDLRNNKLNLIGNTLLVKQAKLSVHHDEINQNIRKLITGKLQGVLSEKVLGSKNKGSIPDFSLPSKYSLTTKVIVGQMQFHFIQPSDFVSSANSARGFSLFPLPINAAEAVPYHYDPSLVISSEGAHLLENQLLQDISSVHKVLHLYAVLGNVGNFYSYYAHNRYEIFKLKLLKNLEKNISSNGLLRATLMYFEELVGFFVVEIIIYRLIESNQIHFHTKELDKLWEETLNEFQKITFNFAITLPSSFELIQIKEELILILFIILDHNIFYPSWNIELLIGIIKNLWVIFDALQVQSLQRNIFVYLSKSSFQPFQITDYRDFYFNIQPYQLELVEINDEIFSNDNRFSKLFRSSQASQEKSSHLSTSASKKDIISLNKFEANLDALEQQLSEDLLHQDNRKDEHVVDSRGSGAISSKLSMNQHNFLPQTYVFSEFIPLIMRELHAMLIKLLIYGVIPIPEKQNKNFMSEIYKLQSIQNVKFGSVSYDNTIATGPASERRNISSVPGADNVHAMKQHVHSSSSLFHIIQEYKFYQTICMSFQSYYQFIINILTQELMKDGLETILSKAVQIFLDATSLSLATDSFYRLYVVPSLVQAFGKENIDLLYVSSTLTELLASIKTLTNKAQDLMFELLSNKIENLLDASLLFIDFEPETFTINSGYLSNSSINIQNLIHNLRFDGFNAFLVHDNIDSIIEFLKITFMCLTHLPKVIRETVYYISCYKLANCFLEFLMSSKVSRLNVFAILSLDADCKRLIQFAESCGIMHLKECFDELSQMIAALLSPDLPAFGDNSFLRNSSFPRLNPLKFAVLLDKVIFFSVYFYCVELSFYL
jgi:hypothetical protein